jgi:uroporphyrin-III C-methyltransferase
MKRTAKGKVYLAGAGPGDPDLLTVRAHRLLRSASVILHDDLVSADILALAGPQAEIANVGKRCGAKGISQEEIHSRMIESARRGLDVVRLKSGDPGIFGRLAEEIDALEAAGVPFEVVPGITAGLGAAASLGVSLTDRRTASRIVVVTGYHARKTRPQERPDWSALAREDVTLVIYMPGHIFSSLRDELLAAGLAADMPAVIVSNATTPRQQHAAATLATLDQLPRMESPSILLVGRPLERVLRAVAAENPSRAIEEIEIVLSSL